jgi:hypothetical protein
MPTGSKGQKRPADVIGTAVKFMRIATGEEPEDYGNAPAKGIAEQDTNCVILNAVEHYPRRQGAPRLRRGARRS